MDITGKRFNRWTALSFDRMDEKRREFWLCRCDCGVEKSTQKSALISGKSKSCGCLRGETTAARNRTHGLRHTPEWNVWRGLIQRCRNPKNPAFHNYGGRGIGVCDRWADSFEAFHSDMGPRPGDGYQIDRINNDGEYGPGNCRWVTHKENARNMRKSHTLTHDGKTATISEWAEATGMKYLTIFMRVKRGWTDEQALTTPLRE